ncbi:hypothetical protein [Streptomyces odontomachi]|uniref:hypothetical protein n=1 Tax=Streptomyces odontomachi TaxID=2944940 RepID=UPI00210DDC0B|nr:hypothetical protein [Streptomyces sp. ODS25]
MGLHSCAQSPVQEPGEATESTLCDSRVRQLEGDLRALPGLYQESLHQVLPISRQTHQTRVSGSRSRDRLNMAALDSRHRILAILESWAAFVADERRLMAPTGSVPQLAHFLLHNLEWLTRQPPAADFADEVDGLRRELLHTVDSEPGDFNAATRDCVVTDCPGKITMPSQHAGNAAGRGIRCSSGHTWHIHEWITLRLLMERQEKAVHA